MRKMYMGTLPAMRGMLGGCSLVALVATCAPAFAQSSSASDAKQSEVSDIVVVGSLEQTVPQELSRYGNRLVTIESEAIERRAVPDVAQALQKLSPSLYIQSMSGAFDYVSVSLQGSRASDILWLVDGVRINNRLYASTTPLDTIPAAMVERVEVIEGGQALFYGTQAVAGAVNIITKSFADGVSGQISGGVGTDSGRRLNGYVRAGLGRHQFVVYASSDTADGYQPFPDADYQPSATDRRRSYDVQTMGAKYSISPTDQLKLTAGYQRTWAKLDLPLPALINTYYNRREEDLVNVKVDWEPSDSVAFYAKGYYHQWDSFVDRLQNSLTTPGQITKVRDDTFWGYKDKGVNVLLKLTPSGPLEYHVGYDMQRYRGLDDVNLIAPQVETVHAFFGQLRTSRDFSDRLKLSVGARYNLPKLGKSIFVWNASGRYDFNDTFFAQASLGTAYRLPDAYELFSIDACCTLGNPNLKGERSTNVNASIGANIPVGANYAKLELIGFWREVTDLIASVNGVQQNSDRTSKVKGFSAVANVGLTDSLSGNLSYTYSKAINSTTGLQIERVPVSLMKGGLSYDSDEFPVGAMIDFNYSGRTFQSVSGLGLKEYGREASVDLSAYYEFGEDREHRITGSIQNLTDNQYITRFQRTLNDVTSLPYAARQLAPPRTFLATYSYNF